MMRTLALVVFLVLTLACPSAAEMDDAALWKALRDGGHVAMMRHALAPGTGDPDNFDVADCSTQRNLNETGRDQSRKTGALFRENGVDNPTMLSSAWCRCLETARLMDLGAVGIFPALNSFFGQPEYREERLKGVRDYIAALDGTGPSVLMVTHYVTIAGITGAHTGSGQIVVLKPNGRGFEVLGDLGPF